MLNGKFEVRSDLRTAPRLLNKLTGLEMPLLYYVERLIQLGPRRFYSGERNWVADSTLPPITEEKMKHLSSNGRRERHDSHPWSKFRPSLCLRQRKGERGFFMFAT